MSFLEGTNLLWFQRETKRKGPLEKDSPTCSGGKERLGQGALQCSEPGGAGEEADAGGACFWLLRGGWGVAGCWLKYTFPTNDVLKSLLPLCDQAIFLVAQQKAQF